MSIEQSVRVRAGRPDEAESLFRLQRGSALAGFAHIFDPAQHPFPDDAERARWAGYLGSSAAAVLVAEREGDPVGVAVVEGMS